MTPLYVTSDWHLGAIRSGGTTPATAYQLRLDLLKQFEEMLYDIVTDGDLAINGDLLDTSNVPMADLARVFSVLSDWLVRTGKHFYGITGNHDASKNSTNYSSFKFLMTLLVEQFPDQVTHVFGGQLIRENCYALSHVDNQDIFNLELAKVPECDYVLLHCNYDNHFATESDHSLNLSEEQAKQLPVKHIIMGHEHVGRKALGGKVVIVGNPAPSSISDCLNDPVKHLLKITDDGMELVETWKAEGDFSEQDWHELHDTGRFVRVTGTATAAEADRLVTVLARFRKDAKVLVLSNAVKIEGFDDAQEFSLSHAEVTSFNVMEALYEYLGPEDSARVKQLMEPTKEANVKAA
jgi:DNA repair exonuclease SbcCD nuclease subunit